MDTINLSAMLGMQSGVVTTVTEPIQDENPLDHLTLPSHIKYKFRNRKRDQKNNLWRKYHNPNRLQDRLKLRVKSQLGNVKDDAASFLWGPAKLSAAAIAWEKRQNEKRRLAKLHKDRMEFAALTLPRFAERMAQIREERLLALANILCVNLFAGWKVYARQQRIVRIMFGKNINERLSEMIQEWRHTAKTIRHFRLMVQRANTAKVASMFIPWKKYTKYIAKRRRYAYAIYIASNVYEKNMTTLANIIHKWFNYSHTQILLRKSIRRIQLKVVWPSFNSWHLYTTRQVKVKMMLKRHLGNVLIYYFQCWGNAIQNIKKDRARKVKQFAARMKASRLLPGWNAWIYLHSMHKIARYCQSHYRGNRSRKITDPYINNLLKYEKERVKLEENYLKIKMKTVHWKYYFSPRIRSAYHINKKQRRMKYVERSKAIKDIIKANVNTKYDGDANKDDHKYINEVKLNLKNIFTTFILDPRHGIDKKYEVVGVKHLKLVLKECGLNLSKVRFEIFLNRIGLDVIRGQETVSFDDFYAGLQKMKLLPKSMNFYLKSHYAFRHYSGSRYTIPSRLLKRHMARSQMRKDLLEKYRLSSGKKPLHTCEHCHRGFLLYTALYKHQQESPNGCEAMTLDHKSATDIPHFDVNEMVQGKMRNSREKAYLQELIDEIQQEKQERILHPSETLNFAATEIQKIVRGWNVRKKPLLMKMMEWYEFSSTPSSNADCNSSISSNNYDDESIV